MGTVQEALHIQHQVSQMIMFFKLHKIKIMILINSHGAVRQNEKILCLSKMINHRKDPESRLQTLLLF